MRLFAFLALTGFLALTASAESHPSWWTYASPEATALVGIRWDALRSSPFGDAVEAELSSSGPLAFPDLDCLKRAREVVISSPELLAAEAGSFPAATIKDQAARAGLHRAVYHGVALWVPDSPKALGVAQISEQLILVGARKTLESAIDRSSTPTGRSYSSLLPRAARFSQTADLWVVAIRLPDPLANLFVPLDVPGIDFAGQVSVRDGLKVEASFDAPSINAASQIAAQVKDQAQSLPVFAQGLEATSDRRTVNIQMEAAAEEIAAAMRPAGMLKSTPAVAPAPTAPAPLKSAPAVIASAPVPPPAAVTAKFAERKPEPPVAVALAAPTAPPPAAAPQPAEPPKSTEPAKPAPPAGPQVVHIIGLDDGPKSIVLPPLPGN